MKKITAIIFLVLSIITLPVFTFNVIASDDPLYDYGQNQQRQQLNHREKVVHIITNNSNDGIVRIKCGDEIQLELQENGTTGYSWHFDELSYEIISERLEKKSDLDGSPATHIWIFRPKSLAEGVIKMSYYRTWEGKRSDTQQFKVKIVVDCTFR
ncbi:MAG: protease inhibitor I42 family protein [Smithella sp.]